MLALLKNQLGSKTSLRRKAVTGANWMMVRAVSFASIDFVKSIFFRRLLEPAEFGIFGLAMMGIGFLESFSATGMEIMIQNEDDNYRDTLPYYWTVKFFRGLLLTVLAWFMAPLLAASYSQPELTQLIRLLSVCFLLHGMAGFGKDVRMRNLDFRLAAVSETGARLMVFAVSLGVLFWLRNLWAMAIYNVLIALGTLVVSFVIFPWRPSLRWDRKFGHKILVFSASIVTLNILNYLSDNIDRAMIGKFFNMDDLGFYLCAHFLATVPALYLANNLTPIFLPTLRTIKDDPERLRRAFIKGFAAMAALIFGVCLVFALAARPLILIYGEKWLPAVPVFRVLLIFGAFKGATAICSSVIFLKNKPWLISVCTAVRVLIMAGLCYPLMTAWQSTMGMAWAMVISGVASNLLAIMICFHLLRVKAVSQPPVKG